MNPGQSKYFVLRRLYIRYGRSKKNVWLKLPISSEVVLLPNQYTSINIDLLAEKPLLSKRC